MDAPRTPAAVELLQFRHSPYNEKVRWALDLKRVPHRRRSLLPGPHLRTVRRLAGIRPRHRRTALRALRP
jgi:hypothetical protein